MSEKLYKVTTEKRNFKTKFISEDLLKEEKGCFYIREKKTDKWEKLVKLEELTDILEWLNKYDFLGIIIFFVLWIGSTFLFTKLFPDYIALVLPVSLYLIPFLLFYFADIINKVLKKLPPYFKTLSNSKIQKLIEQNTSKPYKTSNSYTSSGYRSGAYSGGSGYSGGGSGGSGSGYSGGYSGGSGGGSGSHTSSALSTYISSADMDNALTSLKDKGFDWKTLANDKTDEEREKLFIEHFGDEEKGKIASDRFNSTDIYPARKSHLTKLIAEGEFEDDSIKTKLLDKVKSFGNTISKTDFDTTVDKIVTFKEKKKRIDNHTKYEGRLSNKDIQAIKQHLGYICMACGLNPAKEYGEDKKGIMEAHHKNPYSEINEGEVREVKTDDFLILCPNCHKLIHKLDSPDDLEGLKELVNKTSNPWWWD